MPKMASKKLHFLISRAFSFKIESFFMRFLSMGRTRFSLQIFQNLLVFFSKSQAFKNYFWRVYQLSLVGVFQWYILLLNEAPRFAIPNLFVSSSLFKTWISEFCSNKVSVLQQKVEGLKPFNDNS